MKKAVSILVSLFAIALLFTGGVNAKIENMQLVQNPSFDEGSTNWTTSLSKQQSSVWWTVSFSNGEVVMELHARYGGAEYPVSAYVYQYITLPQLNTSRIVSATLSMKDKEVAYRPRNVHVRLEISGTYKDFSLSSSWTIRTMNITSFVKQYVGQRIRVQGGWWMYGNGNYGWLGDGSRIYIDWIYLNITYNATSKSGNGGSGWNNGGGSWSGGGGGWWHNGGGWFGTGGSWFGHTGAMNQTYIQYEVNRIQELLSIGGGAIIAVLWVKVAVNYFSSDPERRRKAKEDSLTAFVGTLIVAIAVLGAMWAITGWLVGAW